MKRHLLISLMLIIVLLTACAAPVTTPEPITTPPPPKTDWVKGSPPPVGIGGWQSPRVLTDNEKARVIEIAVNSSRASTWLNGRADYTTSPLDWYAIEWNADGTYASYRVLEYCDEVTLNNVSQNDQLNLKLVSPFAYWYPGITIRIGENGAISIYQMQIAVDLGSGKVAMFDGPYPPPGQITIPSMP